jgi:hypothetical protein
VLDAVGRPDGHVGVGAARRLETLARGHERDRHGRAARDEQLRAGLVDGDAEVLDGVDREVVPSGDAADDRAHDVQELGPCGDRDDHRALQFG